MDSSYTHAIGGAIRPRHARRLGTKPPEESVAKRPRLRSRGLSGPLSDAEIDAVCRAYKSGARGQVLIGLHGDVRLLTLLLPAQRTQEATLRVLQNNAERLRRLGADGFIHLRRARLRKSGANTIPAMLMQEAISGRVRLVAVGLQTDDRPLRVSAADIQSQLVTATICPQAQI